MLLMLTIKRLQSSFKWIPLHLRNGGFPPRKPDMRMPIFWLTRSGDELFFVNDSDETVDSGHGRVEIRHAYFYRLAWIRCPILNVGKD